MFVFDFRNQIGATKISYNLIAEIIVFLQWCIQNHYKDDVLKDMGAEAIIWEDYSYLIGLGKST